MAAKQTQSHPNFFFSVVLVVIVIVVVHITMISLLGCAESTLISELVFHLFHPGSFSWEEGEVYLSSCDGSPHEAFTLSDGHVLSGMQLPGFME